MLYFFLSYAREDDDHFVQKLYHDLCNEVRLHAGVPRDQEVGFLDTRSIEVGATWSQRLTSAISTCRSFLALCSPRYFVSEPCGREWHLFADRLHQYETATGLRPPALIPVLWLPPRRMHPVAAAIQYHSDAFSDAYLHDGMRQLMRLQRNHDAYLESLSALASQIVETADTHDMPPCATEVPFDQLPSAFHQPTANSTPLRQLPTEPTAMGSQYVHFVVAAPTRAELPPTRTETSYYGDSPIDWMPYRPKLPVPIGEYARSVATKRSIDSRTVTLDDLSTCIELAMRHNQVVVLLVDAWATRVAQQRRTLAEYGEREEPLSEQNTAVMVPWSHDDAETARYGPELSDSLRAIFYKRVAGGEDVMYRSSILTHHAFDADLQAVLEVARNNVFVHGRVYRVPPGPLSERPILRLDPHDEGGPDHDRFT
ncbi:TIR-like protein FxsC [Actinomycetes bacterium KLBMP 9797]